jgi:hypothetical protein
MHSNCSKEKTDAIVVAMKFKFPWHSGFASRCRSPVKRPVTGYVPLPRHGPYYFDDMFILSKYDDQITFVVTPLGKGFSLRNLGPVKQFLNGTKDSRAA